MTLKFVLLLLIFHSISQSVQSMKIIDQPFTIRPDYGAISNYPTFLFDSNPDDLFVSVSIKVPDQPTSLTQSVSHIADMSNELSNSRSNRQSVNQLLGQSNDQSNYQLNDQSITTFVNHSMMVLLCTQSQLDALGYQSINSPAQFCDESKYPFDASNFSCLINELLGVNDKLKRPPIDSINQTIESSKVASQFVSLMFVNCDGGGISGKFDFLAKNSEGYLSLTEKPYQSLFAVTAAIWSVIFLIWAIHLMRWTKFWSRLWNPSNQSFDRLNNQSFNMQLQKIFFLYPISCFLADIPKTFYWTMANETGVYPRILVTPIAILDCINVVIFFSIVALISMGYGIIIQSISQSTNPPNNQPIKQFVGYGFLTFVSYFCLVWVSQLWSGGYYLEPVAALGGLFVMKYLLGLNIRTMKSFFDAIQALYSIDSSIYQSNNPLNSQAVNQLINQPNQLNNNQLDPSNSQSNNQSNNRPINPPVGRPVDQRPLDLKSSPLYIKFQMFRIFQMCLLFWFGGYLMIYLWNILQSNNQSSNQSIKGWISEALNQAINVLLAILIGLIFSMRAVSPYYYYIAELYARQEDASDQSNNQSNNQPNNQSNNQSMPQIAFWSPGMPYPPISQSSNQWLQNEEEENAPLIILSFNQSNNQSNSQSINQSNNQSNNQVMIGQFVSDKPPSRIPNGALQYFPRDLAENLANQSTDQSINQSIGGVRNRRNPPVNQSNNRSNNQSINQSNNHSQHSSTSYSDQSNNLPHNQSFFSRLFSRNQSNNQSNNETIEFRQSLLSDDERKENDSL